MKKIALAIIIIGLIGFYFLDNSNKEKKIVQTQPITKEKLEENQTIKEIAHKVRDKAKKVEFNRSTIVEEKNETKELKWCIKSAVYDLGNGRKSKIIYEDGARITSIDAQTSKNMPKRKMYEQFDSNGNVESIETYLNDNEAARFEEVFKYENGVLKTRTMMANYLNGEIGKVNFYISYDDEFIAVEDKSTKEDISFLLDPGLYIIPPNYVQDINMEYHEEYDEEGRKIFAYSQKGDRKYKSIQYFYNGNGELYASTSTYYQMSRINVNETKFYDKDKKVIKVYRESLEELSDRKNRAKELAKENGHLKYWREEMDMLMKDKIFQKDLTKSFKYNKNGQLVEEYLAWDDSTISYIYDEHGNLTKKIDVKTKKVLFEQKFEVCEDREF